MTRIDIDALARRLAALELPASGSPVAAVAAVLRQAADAPEVLFIRRADRASDPWSGHMAFPGGRVEPTDLSLEHTAVRETQEELGLDLRTYGRLLGRLEDVPTHKSGIVVRPYVWSVPDAPPLRPNCEVAEVHWISLAALMSGERDTTFGFVWNGATHRFPAYSVVPSAEPDRVVWGLTYRMLQSLFEVVRADLGD